MLRALFKTSSYATGKRLQEHADTVRLWLLTGAYEAWPKPAKVTAEDLDELPSIAELRAIVSDRVQMQALTMLSAWHHERPPPQPPESSNSLIDEVARAQLEVERAAEMAAAQRRAWGFELRVAPSSAGSGSGDGVLLSGSALPGAAVAFYPGVTYEPHDVIALPNGTRFFDDNNWLMARFDRAIVDASPKALALLPGEARALPLCVAQMVNHPPRDVKPNVVPAPVYWDRRVPAELIELLPNVSYERSSQKQRALLLDTGDGNDGPRRSRRWDLSDIFRHSIAEGMRPAYDEEVGPVLKGIALIATRSLKDEELFLNYRLNPKNKNPEWYVPVDVEEDKRRWS